MRSIIFYYSYTGTVKKLAQAFANKTGADLYELADFKRPGKLQVFLRGCPAAIQGKPTPIERISVDVSAYEKFVVMAPVWASNPAPPVNNLFYLLPKDAELSLFLVSASGKSGKDKILARLHSLGYNDVEFMDIKKE